jgi:hypothetical protein
LRSGDRKLRSGDRKLRSGDRKLRSGDRKLRSGDRKLRSGDRKLRSGKMITERVCKRWMKLKRTFVFVIHHFFLIFFCLPSRVTRWVCEKSLKM